MGAVTLDRPRVLPNEETLGELQDDAGQPLRAIALHIFRPADDALVGGDLQKRVDPPAGVAVQIFDLDDLHRRLSPDPRQRIPLPSPLIMRRSPTRLNRAPMDGVTPGTAGRR